MKKLTKVLSLVLIVAVISYAAVAFAQDTSAINAENSASIEATKEFHSPERIYLAESSEKMDAIVKPLTSDEKFILASRLELDLHYPAASSDTDNHLLGSLLKFFIVNDFSYDDEISPESDKIIKEQIVPSLIDFLKEIKPNAMKGIPETSDGIEKSYKQYNNKLGAYLVDDIIEYQLEGMLTEASFKFFGAKTVEEKEKYKEIIANIGLFKIILIY